MRASNSVMGWPVNLSDLSSRVSQRLQGELQQHLHTYQSRSGSPSFEGFLRYLGAVGRVDPALLRELHGLGEVELPRREDPSAASTAITSHGPPTGAASPGASTSQGQPPDSTVAASPEQLPQGTKSPAPSPWALLLARRFSGVDTRYESLAVLGQGAMGSVSIARDVHLRRKVALKTVLPEMAEQPDLIERFLSEMRITAQLEHPNIVPIYALEVAPDGTIGYAMKLVHGQDLLELLQETRQLVDKGQALDEDHTVEKRLEIFLKVCDALEVAHQKGIIHRDLKPSNIMVGRHNEVYLMDWGIARPMGDGGAALDAGIDVAEPGSAAVDLTRTRLGSTIGTPAYMSPEQADGRNHELDGRSDQYAMGLILQECVSLQRAVVGATLDELLTKAKAAKREPSPIGHSVGQLPPEIDAIVSRATSHRREARYPSMKAMADDIRRYLRGEAIVALPDSAARKAGRWVSRHRMASLALMLGLGLTGAFATIGVLFAKQSEIAGLHALELRRSEFQTESAIQAQLIDRELTHYESAVAKFIGAAQRGLSGQLPSAPMPLDDQLAQGPLRPPDLGPSKRYGKDVSVLTPVVSVAPGVDRALAERAVQPLGSLSPAFRELMLDTAGITAQSLPLAAQRAQITAEGVPALRVLLALSPGVSLSFPAMAGTSSADPRQDPAYQQAMGTRGLLWADPVTRGEVLLPLAGAVYDDGGAFRGAAVLEVSLDRLLSRPGAFKLDYVRSKRLVTREGRIISEENVAGPAVPLSPLVIAAISAGQSGSLEHIENGRKVLTTYYPLSTLDWYYVAVADVESMTSSSTKVGSSDPRKVTRLAAKAASAAASARAAQHPAPSAPVEPPDAGVPDASPDPESPPPSASSPPPPAPDAGAALPGLVGRPLVPFKPVPSASRSAEPVERNPFDKWHEYGQGKAR